MYSNSWYDEQWYSNQQYDRAWQRRPGFGSNYINPWCGRPYPPGLTCYRVQGWETLWDIAGWYNRNSLTTVLQRLNPGLNPYNMQRGDLIMILNAT